MAWFGLIAPIVGSAVSAFGAIQQGMAAKNAAEYQAQVARNNALRAEQMKRSEIQKGLIEAEEQDRTNSEIAGRQRNAMAASGFDLNEGTMREIGVSQTILGRTDSLRRAHAGQLAGWKYQAQAENFRADAQLSQMRGKNAMTAGLFNAGGSLIGGATKFADKWQNYNSMGYL